MQHSKPKCVFRNFSLSVTTFDQLKAFQRQYERQHKVKLTNSQALAILIERCQPHCSKEGEQ